MLSAIVQVVARGAHKRVLDVGCGTGNAAHALWASGRLPEAEFVGIDNSPAMLARANRKHSWLTTIPGSLDERLPFGDDEFDVVIASNVLYTLANPSLAVTEMFRVLRAGGQLIVTTPRHNPDIGAIVREHVKMAGPDSLLRHLPALLMVGVLNLFIVRNTSYKFFTRNELCELLRTDQLETTYADQVWFAQVGKEG